MSKQILFLIEEISYGGRNKHNLIVDCPDEIEDNDDADSYLETQMKDIMDDNDFGTVLTWKVKEVGFNLKTPEEKKDLKREKLASKLKEKEEKATSELKNNVERKQLEHNVPEIGTPQYFGFLKGAWIVGCITQQDEILSVIAWFSDAEMHGDYFPNLISARRWRWSLNDWFSKSVYSNPMSSEDWDRIIEHLKKKYDVPFTEDGRPDSGTIYEKADGWEYNEFKREYEKWEKKEDFWS